MQIIQEIMNEAASKVAQHYAQKMIAAGMNPTEQAVSEAIAANWETVSEEIASLYSLAVAELGETA